MEDDILDDFSEPKETIRNATISASLLGFKILYGIASSFIPIPQSTPKFIVVFAIISLIIIPFLGVFYAYQSFAKKEDSIWFKMIGTLGNGILALVYLTLIFDGQIIDILKSLLGMN